ncbi:MAG: endonuclease III [Syntrophales bacterium]|nr:endonuclease III [Syntrophales bacterium]
MDPSSISQVVELIAAALGDDESPSVSKLAADGFDPFVILISTILSLRTKDEVTAAATERLFARAATPEEMLALPEREIEEIIYPVGFYRHKARTIHAICRALLGRFGGRVPGDIDVLLTLPGVGRKTANLVVSLGFGKDGICVDTHVHRIVNRLGYVKTRNPAETEVSLRRLLPKELWRSFNTLLVAFGRRTCRPVSPLCSTCEISRFCDRVGVVRSR